MKHISIQFLFVIFIASFLSINCSAQNSNNDKINTEMSRSNKLAVLWTSADKDVAEKMVYMYTYNAAKQEWWDEVVFIIWGPSSKLLSEDDDLQAYLKKMQDVGIKLYACKACADMYGVSEKLESLEIEVKYMGQDLTEYLKTDYKVITF